MEELTQYVSEGTISPDDYAYDGTDWITVSQLLDPSQKISQRDEPITDTAKTENTITHEIWNPETVGTLSLFLTPVWSSILLSKNWKFLNCPERAGKVNAWGWAWLIVLITYLFVTANFLENVINFLIIPLLIV